jgi:hypothetical protein
MIVVSRFKLRDHLLEQSRRNELGFELPRSWMSEYVRK